MTATAPAPPRRRALRVGTVAPEGTGERRAPSAALTSLPFVLLIAVILGGGLLALLMVNNSLAAGSFEQARLRAEQVALFEQEQALRQEVQRLSSPTSLRGTARKLGMLPAATTAYIDIESGRILGTPMAAGGAGAGSADPVVESLDPSAEETADTAEEAAASTVIGDPGDSADAAAATGAPGGDSATTGAVGDAAPGGSATARDGDGAELSDSGPMTAYDRAVVSGEAGR